MKKITLLSALFGIISSVNSQTIQLATGDTLLYIPFKDIYVNAADMGTFSTNNEDKDGYSIVQAKVFCDWSLDGGGSFQSNWNTLYKTTGGNTNYCIGALTAFSNDSYQADDWYTVGPITIPSGGATLVWKDRVSDDQDRNGYEVKLSTTGLMSSNFTAAPIYSQPDLLDDPTITTNWYSHSYVLNSSTELGQKIYFAFHHNGTDVSTLMIDNIMVMNGITFGINEPSGNIIKLDQNIPNPFNHTSVVNYRIEKGAEVTLTVCDITGRKVLAFNEGFQSQGSHQVILNSDKLSKGIFFYTLKAGENSLTKKMIVTE